MLNQKYSLEGFLVGIGKVRKDGSVEYRELEKPIHNQIVRTGLNLMLDDFSSYYYGQSNWLHASTKSLWCWYYSNDTTGNPGNVGPLTFCSFGTDSTATNVETQTNLNALVERYFTKYLPAVSGNNWPYWGTTEFTPGTMSMRVSHKSSAVSSTTNVNEIGYWGAKKANATWSSGVTYRLFSRIVLPTAYTLEAGESLITTYQLNCSFGDYQTTSGNFFGLLDSEGNPLKYQSRRVMYHNGFYWGIPHISTIGLGVCCNNNTTWPTPGSWIQMPIGFTGTPAIFHLEASNWVQTVNRIGYSLTDKEIPAWGTAESGLTDRTISGAADRDIGSTKDFVAGTNYREGNIVLPNFWPLMSNPTDYVDIHYLNIAGVAYRFGYDNGGTWVPQAWRKYGNQTVNMTFRTTLSTPDFP